MLECVHFVLLMSNDWLNFNLHRYLKPRLDYCPKGENNSLVIAWQSDKSKHVNLPSIVLLFYHVPYY